MRELPGSSVDTLAAVLARDRFVNVVLLGLAALAWSLVAVVFTTRSPVGDAGVQLLGATCLGLALGTTSAPLFWLAAFARQRRIAYRGDWVRAVRRGMWVGLLVALFVLLRTQDALSPPVALFVVVMVALVELTLSFER